MERVKIEILHPKAKSLLENLADLNLIAIEKAKPEFKALLNKLRIDDAPTPDEITTEVELVRKARYEK